MKNCILLFILFSCCENRIVRKSEVVGSDKEIALTLAERKWNEIYGKATISKQKPFIIKQKNDSIYTVRGSYPEDMIGGVASAEVNVRTKKVIKYTHGE
ncbi:NTF2 fold immunity protein [Chryseobacterium sp.]|uniref:NTF2 fold immunity protein n=1 Tax=Chryseobacterium sp. TaxID=1871047 RepID=UPI00260FCE69|nr:NTF2 fold immunity protein [Chryseobacterium sp.]